MVFHGGNRFIIAKRGMVFPYGHAIRPRPNDVWPCGLWGVCYSGLLMVMICYRIVCELTQWRIISRHIRCGCGGTGRRAALRSVG